MIVTPWPNWVSWLLLISVVLTLVIAWMLSRSVGRVQHALADAGIGRTNTPARTRAELEEKYVRGTVDREVYDRWKHRLK